MHNQGKLLGYGEYRKFKNAIEKAEEACKNSDQAVADHFVHVGGMIEVGKGARRKVQDVHLTRYACYLLVENADPSKPIVALGQAYFAVQTRRQEINDKSALANLPEDQKRLIFRSLMSTYNVRLAEANVTYFSILHLKLYIRSRKLTTTNQRLHFIFHNFTLTYSNSQANISLKRLMQQLLKICSACARLRGVDGCLGKGELVLADEKQILKVTG